MSTTTSKVLYYLNRLANIFLYKIKFVGNELEFEINTLQIIFSTICTIFYIFFITLTGVMCVLVIEDHFMTHALRLSHFAIILITYANAFSYQKRVKWVFKKIYQLDNTLKPEMKNPKIVKVFLTQKVLIILFSLIHDFVTFSFWQVPIKCYAVGYVQTLPSVLMEISYVFGLTKLENQINACRKNLNLSHLDCLNEIKKCRRIIDSLYQIPILIKISMRFADSLVVFRMIIHHLMGIASLPFEGILSMTVWQFRVIVEIIFALYLIQRNDDKVRFTFNFAKKI